jgi:hypothetical protein
VFYVIFCRSLFVILFFFCDYCIAYCLSFDWRIMNPLASKTFLIKIRCLLAYFHFIQLALHSSSGHNSKYKSWLGLWCLKPLSTIFQLYRGANGNTRRKPPIFIWIETLLTSHLSYKALFCPKGEILIQV